MRIISDMHEVDEFPITLERNARFILYPILISISLSQQCRMIVKIDCEWIERSYYFCASTTTESRFTLRDVIKRFTRLICSQGVRAECRNRKSSNIYHVLPFPLCIQIDWRKGKKIYLICTMIWCWRDQSHWCACAHFDHFTEFMSSNEKNKLLIPRTDQIHIHICNCVYSVRTL